MTKKNHYGVIKASYFANWADMFGFPIASSLLPIVARISFLTPNVISILSFLLFTLGSLSLFLIYPYHLFVAALLLFAGYIGDDLDGQVARIRKLSSTLGDYLDKVLDVLKIFILTSSLSYAVYKETDNIIFIFLGFAACFFFNYRYYIKLETVFSKTSRDQQYLENSAMKRKEIEEQLDEKFESLSKTLSGRLHALWLKHRLLFMVDEAEFVIITAVFALINRLGLALVILAVSQMVLAFYRVIERGYQLHSDSENLLKPMRK